MFKFYFLRIFAGFLVILFSLCNLFAIDLKMKPIGPYYASVRSIIETEDGTLFALSSGGMWKSTDKGESWEKFIDEQRTYCYLSMFYHNGYLIDNAHWCGDVPAPGAFAYSVSNGNLTPLDQHFIYTTAFTGNGSDEFYVATKSGLYSKTGAGEWQNINETKKLYNDLVYLKNGKLIAAKDSTGLYISNDKGQTWDTLAFPYKRITNVVTRHDYEIYAPVENDRIYVSLDGGKTINGFTEQINVNDLYVSNDNYVFACTDKGYEIISIVLDTIKGGGLENYNVLCMKQTKDGALYAGTWFNGIFKSTDFGLTWKNVSNGISDMNIESAATDKAGNVYVVAENNDCSDYYKGIEKTHRGVYKLNIKNNEWTEIVPKKSGQACYPVSLAVSPDDSIFIETNQGLFKYYNDSAYYYNEVSNMKRFFFDNNKNIIALTNYNYNWFWRLDGNHIWYSKNWIDWDSVNLPLVKTKDYEIFYNYLNVQDNNILLSATEELDSFFAWPMVYSSSDLGNTWQGELGAGIHDETMEAIKLDNSIYLMNLRGTNELCGSWIFTNCGKCKLNISKLNTLSQAMILDKQNYLYIGTNCGLWKSDEPTSVDNEYPPVVRQDYPSIYPNPASDEAILKYHSDTPGVCNLELSNSIGQIILSRNIENIQVGKYSESLDFSGFQPGVYFYKISKNNELFTGKVVIVR